MSDGFTLKFAVAFKKKSDTVGIVSGREANEQRIDSMQDVDLVDVMQRTTAFATRMIRQASWRGSVGGVLPDGMDAPSIAQMALEKVLGGAKWDEGKPLWLVLQGLVRGAVGNLAKSAENRRLANVDDLIEQDREGRPIPPLEGLEGGEASPSVQIQQAEDDGLVLELIDTMEADSHERRIAEAIFEGAVKRADIMARSGLNSASFEAAKKRLRRFLEKYRQQRAAAHH